MSSPDETPPPETTALYHRVMHTLTGADIPFLAGGAHALKEHAGIGRTTKDLDLFIRPADLDRTLDVLSQNDLQTEIRFPHWLAKAHAEEGDIDLIFRNQNGLFEVTDSWLDRASTCELFGISVKICPPEEMIGSKAFVMERTRYDGSDVAHLLYSCAAELDWDHLLDLFGEHWRVLLSHLILFGFIYPSERDRIPRRILDRLFQRLQEEKQNTPPEEESLCQGTLLSRTQYLVDVQQRGFQDVRLPPQGTLTRRQIRMLEEDAEENEEA